MKKRFLVNPLMTNTGILRQKRIVELTKLNIFTKELLLCWQLVREHGFRHPMGSALFLSLPFLGVLASVHRPLEGSLLEVEKSWKRVGFGGLYSPQLYLVIKPLPSGSTQEELEEG